MNEDQTFDPSKRTVHVFSGGPDAFKAAVKAKIAADKLKIGDKVKGYPEALGWAEETWTWVPGYAGRTWIYVEHLINGEDLFVMEKDFMQAPGKGVPIYKNVSGAQDRMEPDDGVFLAREPLPVAEAAGAQLMTLENMPIIFDAYKRGILEDFGLGRKPYLLDGPDKDDENYVHTVSFPPRESDKKYEIRGKHIDGYVRFRLALQF